MCARKIVKLIKSLVKSIAGLLLIVVSLSVSVSSADSSNRSNEIIMQVNESSIESLTAANHIIAGKASLFASAFSYKK
jgi:hypothetical protein